MNVLIVEDEEHLATGLRFNLEAEGYKAEVAPTGESALERLASGGDYELILLDVMLPGIDGFEVAKAIRESGNFVPILMLTALGRPEDVIRGFEAGADDYLPKPFDLNVLLARVRGLIRRSDWAREISSRRLRQPVNINGRIIDLANLRLTNGDNVLELTQMEARLLGYFLDNCGRAISRKEILQGVWGLVADTDTRAIDNFIVRLRKYLEDEPNEPKILKTVRGVGYRLDLPAE
jgi:DNA-binding response OmpR family regulator